MTSHSSRRSLLARALRTTAVLARPYRGLASAQSAKPVRIWWVFRPAAAVTPLPACWPKAQDEPAACPWWWKPPRRRRGRLRRRPQGGARPMGTTLFLSHDHTISILPRW